MTTATKTAIASRIDPEIFLISKNGSKTDNEKTLPSGKGGNKLTDAERFDLVLGITCHAVYHAGQIQLLKRLHAAE